MLLVFRNISRTCGAKLQPLSPLSSSLRLNKKYITLSQIRILWREKNKAKLADSNSIENCVKRSVKSDFHKRHFKGREDGLFFYSIFVISVGSVLQWKTIRSYCINLWTKRTLNFSVSELFYGMVNMCWIGDVSKRIHFRVREYLIRLSTALKERFIQN